MRNLRGTYVHRGDVIRRTRRVKQTLLVLGFCVATGVIAASREPATVNAEPAPKVDKGSFFITPGEARKLQNDLATAKGFVKKRGFQWPVLADGMPVISAAGVTGFPTFALVGPDGRLRAIAHSAAIAPTKGALDVASLSTWVAAHRKQARQPE